MNQHKLRETIKHQCPTCGAQPLDYCVQATTRQRIDDDMPAYLEFLVLAHLRNLKKVSPDHILVKAVEGALDQSSNPDQLTLDFGDSPKP